MSRGSLPAYSAATAARFLVSNAMRTPGVCVGWWDPPGTVPARAASRMRAAVARGATGQEGSDRGAADPEEAPDSGRRRERTFVAGSDDVPANRPGRAGEAQGEASGAVRDVAAGEADRSRRTASQVGEKRIVRAEQ